MYQILLGIFAYCLLAQAQTQPGTYYPDQVTGYESNNLGDSILIDLSSISQHWGQISSYFDSNETYFGVRDVGLPYGCGIEQVHILHRHAQRFLMSSYDDGLNDEKLCPKDPELDDNKSFEEFYRSR
jgi:hypothetical protein